MERLLSTDHLRRFVNTLVDATETSPSLAEMVRHHLDVAFARLKHPPFYVWYEVHDAHQPWLRLGVTDGRGYPDAVYRRGEALLRIGINGVLANPEDDAFAKRVFGTPVFRRCRACGFQASSWLEYYGHVKLEHWATPDAWSA